MATQTAYHHPYHCRFSPGMTVSADELSDEFKVSSSATLCPACGRKVSVHTSLRLAATAAACVNAL